MQPQSNKFPSRLTAREREVVLKAIQGGCIKELAAHFGLSTSRIKGLLTLIYRVYGVENRAQLVLKFYSLPPYESDSHD